MNAIYRVCPGCVPGSYRSGCLFVNSRGRGDTEATPNKETTARRKGSDWFVGTITNDSARTIKLKFDFLLKEKNYLAKIYSDEDHATTATKVGVETKKVNASTVLEIKLKSSGGQAIWLHEN